MKECWKRECLVKECFWGAQRFSAAIRALHLSGALAPEILNAKLLPACRFSFTRAPIKVFQNRYVYSILQKLRSTLVILRKRRPSPRRRFSNEEPIQPGSACK